MAKRLILVFTAALLVLTSLACGLPVTVTIGQPTESTSPLPPAPTLEPTSALPTEPPAAIPTETSDGTRNLGAILVDPMDKKGVNLLSPEGAFLAELMLGNDLSLSPNTTVPSSDYALPNESNRVMFYTYPDYALAEYRNPGDIPLLANLPNLVALVGDGWCDAFSYATTEFTAGGTQNALYLSPGATVGGVPPVISELDPRGFAIFPVSAICGDGKPGGVWYAHIPYGIGGDIVFPPYHGLYRLEAGQPSATLVLDENQRFSGISDDQGLVAYSRKDDLSQLFILDVKKNTQVSIPVFPGSDRGAGDAVFSPDNTQVAWLEGSGFMMSETPNFHAVVRIAPTSADVQLVKQKTDTEFANAVGLANLWIRPVAWLDNTNLLVEGRGNTWEDAFLLKLDTSSGTISLFGKGVYLGKYYSAD